jgi:hypothetical protein
MRPLSPQSERARPALGSQAVDVGGQPSSARSLALPKAFRTGSLGVAADLKARGRAVPAGNRVTLACQLARARQPARE